MLDVEVIGIEDSLEYDPQAPLTRATAVELEELCALALSSAGIEEGHVAIEFVDAERIRELNREHRGIDAPTDVLSFGIDDDGTSAGPRELGDIVICEPRQVSYPDISVEDGIKIFLTGGMALPPKVRI